MRAIDYEHFIKKDSSQKAVVFTIERYIEDNKKSERIIIFESNYFDSKNIFITEFERIHDNYQFSSLLIKSKEIAYSDYFKPLYDEYNYYLKLNYDDRKTEFKGTYKKYREINCNYRILFFNDYKYKDNVLLENTIKELNDKDNFRIYSSEMCGMITELYLSDITFCLQLLMDYKLGYKLIKPNEVSLEDNLVNYVTSSIEGVIEKIYSKIKKDEYNGIPSIVDLLWKCLPFLYELKEIQILHKNLLKEREGKN